VKDPQHNNKPPFPWQLCAAAAVACAALTVGAYAIGVRPLLEERAHEAEQRQTLDERRGTASDLATALADVQRDLERAKQELAQTPVRLQPATLVNQRLAAIARVATDCQVALDEMRPGSAADSTHFQTVPIRIVGSGRYPACARFLRELRRTFGDMGVRKFTTTNTTPAALEPTAAFQAELVWFTELPRK
jgi:Tfp pilus assembly protein PilO